MKTLIIFFLIQAAVTAPEYFSKLIIDATDATIEQRVSDEEGNYIVAKVDSYYTEELIKMQIRSLIGQYEDVTVARSWERAEDCIRIFVNVSDKMLLIEYDDSKKLIIFVWK